MVLFVSSGAGLGYSPIAPGTFGTLAGIPVYLAFSLLPLWGYLIATGALTVLAIWAADRAEAIHGGHDDGRIVIDEAAGYVATMTGVVPGVWDVILGFFIFRVIDIFKPWPCDAIDRRMPGGAGVVLDDMAAGVYGALLMHLFIWLWPTLGRPVWQG